MNVAITHRFNPASALAGSRREKAPGGVRATRLQESMYTDTQNAVKGIARKATRRLLASRSGGDHADIPVLLDSRRIDRRDGGGVDPYPQINALRRGYNTSFVGQLWGIPNHQYKSEVVLAVWSPLDSLESVGFSTEVVA